jgi:hypothetical protein
MGGPSKAAQAAPVIDAAAARCLFNDVTGACLHGHVSQLWTSLWTLQGGDEIAARSVAVPPSFEAVRDKSTP